MKYWCGNMDKEIETKRHIEIFLDYWIYYRNSEPYMPVLRSNQKDFKNALIDFVELEVKTRLNQKGESIDEYLGIKENTRELGMVSSIVTREE